MQEKGGRFPLLPPPIYVTHSCTQFLHLTDHFEEVRNLSMDYDNNYALWTPPLTWDGCVKIEYRINFSYINGTKINQTLSPDTKYFLPETFDKCESVVLTIETKTVCGDVSSDPASWSGSVLRE